MSESLGWPKDYVTKVGFCLILTQIGHTKVGYYITNQKPQISLTPAVTTKAVAGAKSLGSFLYSAVNKAGAKVSEASAKIKKTVEENVCISLFFFICDIYYVYYEQ